MPSLFALLRVLADRSGAAKFLLLGSASPELVDAIRPMQQLISPPAGTHNAHPGAGLDLALPVLACWLLSDQRFVVALPVAEAATCVGQLFSACPPLPARIWSVSLDRF